MGFDPDDVAVLVDLVRYHLLLPDTATRRDLDDPTTIAAGGAGRRQPADAAPAGRADRGGQQGDRPLGLGRLEGRPRRRPRGSAPTACSRASPSPWRPTDIVASNRELMAEVRGTGLPSVSLQPPHVIVAAPDRPGLFSSVAGALALNGMDVRAANVSGEDGVAVEVFTVEVARGTWPDTAKLREDLAAVLSDRLAIGRAALRARAGLPPAAGLRRPSARERRQRRQRGLRDRHRAGGAGPGRDRPASPHHRAPSSTRASTSSPPGSLRSAKWSWTPSTSGSPEGPRSPMPAGSQKSPGELRRNWDFRPAYSPSRMPAAMSGEHVRTRSGPRRWLIAIVCVVVRRHRGRRLRRRRPAAQQPGLRHAVRPASRPDRRFRLAHRSQRGRRLHRDGPVLHRPRPGQSRCRRSARRSPARGPCCRRRCSSTRRPVRSCPAPPRPVTVPGGSSGVVGSEGQHLAQSVTSQFSVAPGSILRLQQLLAELGYLPLTFTPASPLDLARRRRATTRWGRSPGAGRTSRSRSRRCGRRAPTTSSPGAPS